MLNTVFINKHVIDFKKKLTFNTWDPTFVGDLLEREDRLRQSSKKKRKPLDSKFHIKQSIVQSSFTVNVYLILQTSKKVNVSHTIPLHKRLQVPNCLQCTDPQLLQSLKVSQLNLLEIIFLSPFFNKLMLFQVHI